MRHIPVPPPEKRHTYRQTIHLCGRMEALPAGVDLHVPLVGCFQGCGTFSFRQVSPYHAIHCIEGGAGVMESDGMAYRAAAGDLFVFFPGQEIYYQEDAGSPWRYTWFPLMGRRTDWALEHVGLTRRHPHRPGSVTPALQELLAELIARSCEPALSVTYPVAWAWRFVDLLTRSHETAGGNGGAANLAETARLLMEAHYETPPSIGEVAAQLRVHPSTLFRHFQARFGMSPKAFLDTMRLRRAGQLLSGGTLSIKEVASACGYTDSAYFIRTFRRHHGMPPGKWRRGQGR